MPRQPDHEKRCGHRQRFDISGDPPAWPFHVPGGGLLVLTCDLDQHGASPWHGCTVTLLDHDRDVGVPITVSWREPDEQPVTPTVSAEAALAGGAR